MTNVRFNRGAKIISLPILVIVTFLVYSNLQAGEPALSYTHKSEVLQWGGCPEFIPKGCEISVLHGNPAEKNADIFFKVPGDFAIPHHYHTSAERMVLVSGTMKVTYDKQETEILKPGTYAYGPAKLPHTAFCEAGDPCVLFIAFEEPIDAFEVMKPSK